MDCYFTKTELLRAIAKICNKYLKSASSTFVDFSCGANEFVKYLNCKTISFDINPVPDAIQADWLKVKKGVPPNSMIGLNPPFGYKGTMAKKFIQHAIKFKPLFIVVIIPKTKWRPSGYKLISEKDLPSDSFYIPETGKNFSYPTTLYLYKKDDTIAVDQIKREQLMIPHTISIRCHVTNIDKTQMLYFICIRRTGFYAGRQFYVGHNGSVTYINQGKQTHDTDWDDNSHSLKNAFWVLFLKKIHPKAKLISFCQHFREWMNKNAADMINNSHLQSPSLRKGQILDVLQEFSL